MRVASPSARMASAWHSGPRLRGQNVVHSERAWESSCRLPLRAPKAPRRPSSPSPGGLGYILMRCQLWGPRPDTGVPEVPLPPPSHSLSLQNSTIKARCPHLGFYAFPDWGVLTSCQLPAASFQTKLLSGC